MNNTEKYIQHLYKSINIDQHEQLSIDRVAVFLNIDVIYWEYSSAIVCKGNSYKVFIDDNLNYKEQWQDFGHEMAHFCWHGGSQHNLLQMFLDYQETKADYFSLHFCIPTFMLRELKGVTAYDVMTIFNVSLDFALKRLEMHKNKLIKESESKCIAGKLKLSQA